MFVEKVDGSELRFKNPGRLLLVVIGFIFWGVGFIDLLGHTSAEPDIFGLYSLPFFVFILLYGATIILWLALFINANLLSRVTDWIGYIQQNTWLALTVFVGLGIALWVIFEWDRWSRMPGLQFAAFGLVLLVAAILLFSNWHNGINQQWWRKLIAYPLIALLIIEIIIQIMAWFGVLPGVQTIGGDFVPYERLYNNAEGYRNGFANRTGWTFPDFELDDEMERILVVGGSFVQALQVEPDQQLGPYLSQLINNQPGGDDQSEIISIGLPGFGPSPFIYEDALNEIPNSLAYDEIVVLFHLGDDFQSPEPSENAIRYFVGDSSKVEVHPDDARLRHDLTHYYLRGYLSFQPVESLRSNYLTPKVISSFLSNENQDNESAKSSLVNNEYDFTRLLGYVTGSYMLNEPGHAGIKSTDLDRIPQGNNFLFVPEDQGAREAIEIVDGIFETAQEISSGKGISLRIVTIPVFPKAFYNTFPDDNWQPKMGDYDLFLPEKALIEIAKKHNIPILPMGQYMLADQLKVDEIRSLYLSNGLGHFSAQGQEYFAKAIHQCFYTEALNTACLY